MSSFSFILSLYFPETNVVNPATSAKQHRQYLHPSNLHQLFSQKEHKSAQA